jgi:hypothetical protein
MIQYWRHLTFNKYADCKIKCPLCRTSVKRLYLMSTRQERSEAPMEYRYIFAQIKNYNKGQRLELQFDEKILEDQIRDVVRFISNIIVDIILMTIILVVINICYLVFYIFDFFWRVLRTNILFAILIFSMCLIFFTLKLLNCPSEFEQTN